MCLNLLKDRENVISIVYSPEKFRKISENWEVMERRNWTKFSSFLTHKLKVIISFIEPYQNFPLLLYLNEFYGL